nr:ASKHA domain-containing protein [uncultured Desulfobulbus sp.]
MSRSCHLTVQPENHTLVVEQGTTVLQALQQLNSSVRSDCGGAGVCGKCRVLTLDRDGLSPVSDEEQSCLGKDLIGNGYRLACLATITGEARVTVPHLAEEKSRPQGKKIDAPTCTPDPTVRRFFIAADRLSTPLSASGLYQCILERLPQWPEFPADEAGVQLVRLLADSPEQIAQHGVTLVVHEQLGVRAVLPGDQASRSLGMAVDLGTTTIAGYLCDLQTGELLASRAMFNPQRKYGDDVISRISRTVGDEGVLKEMQRTVVAALEQLAGLCLADCGLADAELDELVVVGNTTMQTIFAGDSPESLGRSPYLPQILSAQNLSAQSLGFSFGKMTTVHIFPVISGFLGGDSVAAALGGTLMHCAEPRLIIDIGTNGELILGCGEKLVATSCATGPALEGAAISCGMRAVAGAIDKVEVDQTHNRLLLHHLGAENGALPLGICGSGLIDAVAGLRQVGVLQESGRLNAEAEGVICDDQGFPQAYVLVPAAESGTGRDITLTLLDVRAFQLAKSALVVGMEKLLEEYGLEDVPHTCITGAFGAHFNWTNGLIVDLLSAKVSRGEVTSGANLAGAGAIMALIDRDKRREAAVLASGCTALELAADPDFNLRFVERTRFPALESQAR